MAKFLKKSMQMQSLAKVRQLQLDRENAILNNIKHQKQSAQQMLLHYQTMYIKGIDELNRERQSSERKMLEALERSIDLAKVRWYKSLQELRDIEEQEKLQARQVREAHLRLKMLEKLDERYMAEHREYLKIVEQKVLDEFAVQSSRRKLTE